MSKIVTFQQANRLVALGYNIVLHCSCHGYECIGCKSVNLSSAKKLSVSEALDWVREEKGIHCSVSFVFKYNDRTDNVDAQYFGQVLQTFPLFIDQVTEEFDTHPLASSALLDAVLTYLEQKEKP